MATLNDIRKLVEENIPTVESIQERDTKLFNKVISRNSPSNRSNRQVWEKYCLPPTELINAAKTILSRLQTLLNRHDNQEPNPDVNTLDKLSPTEFNSTNKAINKSAECRKLWQIATLLAETSTPAIIVNVPILTTGRKATKSQNSQLDMADSTAESNTQCTDAQIIETALNAFQTIVEMYQKDSSVLGHSEYTACLVQYADTYVTHIPNDLQKALDLYELALQEQPDHMAALGNLAYTLHRYFRDFATAEVLYARSVELYPNHASILTKYANFRKAVKRDIVGAEILYQQAIDADSNNIDALGSYAVLLHGVKQEYDEAEKYYKRATEACQYHTNNLSNYALFLADVRRDYEGAEKYYKLALASAPNHANTLYNYGVLMDSVRKRYDEAESLYKRAVEVNPKHAYALYNYAVLLEDVRKDIDGARLNYSLAVEAAPTDISILLDYATFLWRRANDKQTSEEIFRTAFQQLGVVAPRTIDEVPEHLRSMKTVAKSDVDLALQRYCDFMRY